MMAPEGDADDAGLLQHKAHAKVNVSSPVSKTNPMKILGVAWEILGKSMNTIKEC